MAGSLPEPFWRDALALLPFGGRRPELGPTATASEFADAAAQSDASYVVEWRAEPSDLAHALNDWLLGPDLVVLDQEDTLTLRTLGDDGEVAESIVLPRRRRDTPAPGAIVWATVRLAGGTRRALELRAYAESDTLIYVVLPVGVVEALRERLGRSFDEVFQEPDGESQRVALGRA